LKSKASVSTEQNVKMRLDAWSRMARLEIFAFAAIRVAAVVP
jgi:hypothetical protein